MSLSIIRRQILDKLNTITGLYPAEVGSIAGKIIPVAVVNDAAAPVETSTTVNLGFAKGSSTQTIIQKHFNALAVVTGVGQLLYTVTSGKTLYLTEFYINSQAGANTNAMIRDSTTLAGTIILGGLFSAAAAGTQPLQFQFPSPMKFVNGLFLDVGANETVWIQMSGWEE